MDGEGVLMGELERLIDKFAGCGVVLRGCGK